MKVLWGYIKSRKYQVFCFIITIIIFISIFVLYRIEPEAVIYAAMLSVCVCVPVIGIDYYQYKKRYKFLLKMHNALGSIRESKMEAAELLEREYCRIINDLMEQIRQIETNFRQMQQESKDYYAAWIHQIKVPISSMSLILQEEDTSEYQELRAELFRIEQYVSMVLSYVRLNSDSTDFVFQEYSLDEIIRKSVRKYANQFVRKKLQLDYKETDISVITDEKWLSFMLEQMLSNAVKYTEEGRITIRVNSQKCLSITDTGIGIASEDLPRIFEKGFTGYNGRTKGKSTGLGLYLCKSTAEKLSVQVWAESRAGKGTTVYVDLNCADLEVE